MATALTTAQIVQKMYIGFYGRGADVDGLAFWVGKLGDSAARLLFENHSLLRLKLLLCLEVKLTQQR